MKHLKLFENREGDILSQVKELLHNTPISSFLDTLSQEDIIDTGNYIWVRYRGDLSGPHISKHFDPNDVGSTFTINQQEVVKEITKILGSPNVSPRIAQEGITKYKWTNFDTGKNIGMDSLVKTDGMENFTDKEPFGMTKKPGVTWSDISGVSQKFGYELVNSDLSPYGERDLEEGKDCFIKQDIGVVWGEKKPTKLINIIMAQAGEIDQKPVLTLITTYPGISPVDSEGEDIKNKKDFKNFGYAFIKPKMNEKKMNHLMIWENFIGGQRGINEGIFSSSPLFEDEIKVAKNKILKLNGEFGIRAQVSSELQTSNSKITGFMCSISEVPILLHDLEILSPEGMTNRFEDIIRRSMGEKQKYFTQLLEINPGGLFSRFSKISFGTDLRGESYMYFPYKENRESTSGYVIPRIRRQDNTKGVGVKKVSVFFDFSHYDRIYNVKKELRDVGSLQDFWNMNPQGQSFNGGEDLFRGKTTYHLFFRKIED